MKGLYIFDSESDGLVGKSIPPEEHMTKFHCLLFKEYGINRWTMFLDKSHPEFKEAEEFLGKKVGCNIEILDLSEFNSWIVKKPTAIACQNLEGFDMKAFKFALGTEYTKLPKETINGKEIRVYDTLSMSRGLWPDRPLPFGLKGKIKNPSGGKAKTIGSHSLEAWGFKLKNLKVKIEDWKGLPLWKYCDRVFEDVVINELQWDALIREMREGSDKGIDWKIALNNNLKADHLMALQEEQGVTFDEQSAWKLLDRIDAMMKEIADEVEPKLPLKDVPASRIPSFPKDPFGKDGEINSHGWNYARKILGYELNEEFFEYTPPPKTSFKKDGSVGTHGFNYCIKMGISDPILMPDYIRSQINKGSVIRPLPDEQGAILRKQLVDKYIPEKFLKEPMTLSNQEDIKEWLVVDGKWVPTLFNTKDATRDKNKRNRSEDLVISDVWDYIQDKKTSIYCKFISSEMGVNLSTITSTSHPDFSKVMKKARFLVTSPKLKDERGELCPNLEKIDGEMAKQIVKWLSLRNRRAVIKSLDDDKDTGWLNHPRLKVDGKLPARYSGLTNTNRRKHSVIANIPSTEALLGHEMRSLFKVPDGYWQLGIDGSNLEGMVAAQAAYPFDGGAYYQSLSGDPHTTNSKAYSKASGTEVTRSGGKGITYGIMYGAQAAKIASMLGVSRDIGQKVIDAFWDTNFGLKGCREYLEKYWESTGKKYIKGFDNRKIWTRSKHSLLNCYLQSGGAIGMDLAGIIWHNKMHNEGLLEMGAARTIYYHDEYQLQVPDSLIRWKEFDTGFDDSVLVSDILADVKNSKELKAKGKPYKSANEMLTEYSISMDQLRSVINADKEARDLDGGRFVLSGNVRVLDNGNVARCYSRAGEAMVEAIEEAYSQMGFDVPITGSYLVGLDWADCH